MISLEQLITHCKASVTVSANTHRDYYTSVEEELLTLFDHEPSFAIEEIGEERYNRLVAGDSLVILQYYPRTPIGFHLVVGQTLEECLEQVDMEMPKSHHDFTRRGL